MLSVAIMFGSVFAYSCSISLFSLNVGVVMWFVSVDKLSVSVFGFVSSLGTFVAIIVLLSFPDKPLILNSIDMQNIAASMAAAAKIHRLFARLP